MAAKVPIRAVFDGSTATGLAEFQSAEFIALAYGGLGASLSIGSAGEVLKVNSGASALEFGTVEAILNIDGMTDGSGITIVDADKFASSDAGTEKYILASQIKTYIADVTLTTAAQANITSLGTLTTLTVDNIIINGTNIGHTSDTDALAIDSSGNVTASQNFTVNTQTTSDSFNLPITLNGTDGSSTNAGDNIVQNTAANENDRIVYEDATPTHFEKSITWDNVG